MLSDNGAVFTGRSRRGGRVVLEVILNARGISFRHSRPYHPQTCGEIERFHQTLNKWLTRQPRARPRGNFKPSSTPSVPTTTSSDHTEPSPGAPRQQSYHARPGAVPTGTSLDDSYYRIRRDKIDPSGVFTLRHNSHLHHIGIGRRHASEMREGLLALAVGAGLQVMVVIMEEDVTAVCVP